MNFLSALPDDRRQPNLFLAAIRHVCGLPADITALEGYLEKHANGIEVVMRNRTTQTNEPNRCALLMPLLARLPQPLSLIEVGASAGLCLIPDRYDYRYGDGKDLRTGTLGTPLLRCEVTGDPPLPNAYPRVAWAAGLDLNPLDVTDAHDMEWLRTLVWPDQRDRLARLDAAIALARRAPPTVVKGDLTTDLVPLMAEAPEETHLVVFHTAVLAYVPAKARKGFQAMMMDSPAHWISVESPQVFPDITAKLPGDPDERRFIVAENGTPVALAGPHGQSLHWL